MRQWINLFEASDPLDEALWWVQRWISGSMTDEDWEEDWLSHVRDVAHAFSVVQQEVGNRSAVGKPLWRYLALSQAEARQMAKSKMLKPHRFPFQSFTTSEYLALKVGRDLERDGDVHVLVCVRPAPADVMFGMQDLLKTEVPGVASWLHALDHWHDQDEVVVRVTKPTPILGLKRIEF